MKNADKSIHANVTIIETEGVNKGNVITTDGLTKREYFTGIAIQGALANQDTDITEVKLVCELAVKYADEILKQLGE